MSSRIKLLTETLTDRIQNEVSGDATDKLLWLVKHMKQYLERWLAFAELETVGVAATLVNETFYVVIAAEQVMNGLISRSDLPAWFPLEEWNHFRRAVEWIQRTPEQTELELIKRTFESFCLKLPDTELQN